jgi:hypothetical protein
MPFTPLLTLLEIFNRDRKSFFIRIKMKRINIKLPIQILNNKENTKEKLVCIKITEIIITSPDMNTLATNAHGKSGSLKTIFDKVAANNK